MDHKAQDLNGSRTIRRNNTIFVPLPRALWRSCGGCSCAFCKVHPETGPYLDTLAIDATTKAGDFNHAWTCHAPEYRQPEDNREKLRQIDTNFYDALAALAQIENA